MARTYRAEGRQLANYLRGILMFIGLILYYKIPGLHWAFMFIFLIVGALIAEILGAMWTNYRRSQKNGKTKSTTRRKSVTKKDNNSTTATRSKATSSMTIDRNEQTRVKLNQMRDDKTILSSPLAELSGSEFERLLALYFRDQGYIVNEVGIGGNDGGVDLVIIDQRGEKTAVQAKCYNQAKVNVQTVRELVAAKRNHDCILAMLITTSDLTAPAKREAEQFKVEYWHGAIVAQKLKAWGKWQPNKKR